MKKFKLQVEELRVDTFEATSPQEPKGTIYGHVYSRPAQASCNGDDTCAYSCGPACVSLNTCDYFTCPGFVSRYDNNQFCVYC